MKNTAKIALAALGLATTVTAGAAMAEEKTWTTVTIATEGAFPPYNLTKPDGTLDGYEIELSKVLCAHMKVECTIVPQAFDGIIPALNAGKFDAIMAGMSATEKRKEVIDFSLSYGSTGQAFATLKGSDLENMPMKGELFSLASNEAGARKAAEDLKPLLEGKTIGVQSASIAARFIDEYLKGAVEVREYKTTEQHDLDLIAGRVDLVMASMGYLMTAAEKPANADMAIVGPRFQGGFLGAGSSVGLRKSDPELKALFDAAITAAKDDGTIKRLSEKWFGFDLTPR
ncbi:MULTISPECIES: transporter substrate-binding domain-containing protein [unclassified Shinella]|uniref:transporter substrate-binding domain-containing protein n=1 Tax=unclassified Shinella TaxID=2643062 RepID=UPI00102D53A1|nr:MULTISPECIES: transporter substrate-binding domain-containing protein [unclassified Shinella]MCO5151437.1 transporter substrate-binding domain-containing protein [Shinella sp.]MDC7266044.1 transporter substrate-binding domain-containing protein [Shinella sp. HY16]MDC7272941.1 transporter substrate-binding domain-containing protein [Shinella sp. YZ44]TAA60065.1 transporter substrate-binding domain-containing protein [Shinella sp. JR1-6]